MDFYVNQMGYIMQKNERFKFLVNLIQNKQSDT